jgi:hypothetical protein
MSLRCWQVPEVALDLDPKASSRVDQGIRRWPMEAVESLLLSPILHEEHLVFIYFLCQRSIMSSQRAVA